MDTKQAGALGGKARARNRTAAQLSAIGKAGAKARWAKRPKYQAKATGRADTRPPSSKET